MAFRSLDWAYSLRIVPALASAGSGGPDGLAQNGHRPVALEGQGQCRPGGHEGHEGAEERTLPVDGVECLGLRGAEADETRGPDGEAGRLEMSQDLPGVTGGYSVGLDDGESNHRCQVSGVRCQVAMRRRIRSARVRKPTTFPSRTTGKRSTSLLFIRLATSLSV